VELYSAFAYEGPALVPRVKRELAACLARDGFPSVAAAVGADVRGEFVAAAGEGQEAGQELATAGGGGGGSRRWLW
jgi:hypothetical protein